MTTWSFIQAQVAEVIQKIVGDKVTVLQTSFSLPPEKAQADLAFGCFSLAKQLQKNPASLAIEISEKLTRSALPFIETVSASGPYVNILLQGAQWAAVLLKEIQEHGSTYGDTALGKGHSLLIEYSSPNTHKEFHVGHLRNISIGGSLVQLLRASGYTVTPVNYINDIGVHVAKCLWGLIRFHKAQVAGENKQRVLGEIYVEATTKAEEDEGAQGEIQEILQKLENDPKAPESILWRETRQYSIDGFRRIYTEFGSVFEHTFFESDVKPEGKQMAEDLLQKGIARESQGAIILDFEKEKLGVFPILKSDGTGLYFTSDLALAKRKFERYPVDTSIVVTDSRQNLYFERLFRALKLWGFDKQYVHVGYEFVTLPEGAMSSRKGNVVLYEELLKEARERLQEEILRRHPDWDEERRVSQALTMALSALKFAMLKQSPAKKIVFHMDEVLSFDGFSAPYVLYTSARISSILRKANAEQKHAGYQSSGGYSFTTLEEKRLLVHLARFPEVVTSGAASYDPSEIAKYLFDLAQKFGTFYEKHSVLQADTDAIRQARIILITSVQTVLKKGLSLLGISTVEEM